MYPTAVLDFDGNVRPSPISIVQDQQGPNVYFLDMQIMQLSPGICDVNGAPFSYRNRTPHLYEIVLLRFVIWLLVIKGI